MPNDYRRLPIVLLAILTSLLTACKSNDDLRSPFSPGQIAQAEQEYQLRRSILYKKAAAIVDQYATSNYSAEQIADEVIRLCQIELEHYAHARGTQFLTSQPYRTMHEYKQNEIFVLKTRQSRIKDLGEELKDDVIDAVNAKRENINQ